MAKPTLCASEIGKKKANDAFKLSGKTQDFIAGMARATTRQRVAKFLDGANVDRQIFIDICEALKLNWREIAGIEDDVDKDDVSKDIEALVKLARERCAEDIRKRCGTMRVLDMEQPVALTDIYTNVNILEKITKAQRKGLKDLKESCRGEDFYRWGLSPIEQPRLDGIEVAKNQSKLMILGKPGAGKTTFLKFLAMSCINEKEFVDLVPIFVTLKDFADLENRPSLLQFLKGEFGQWAVEIETILKFGKALVLLDGLDEVRAEYDDRVLREIREFEKNYNQNRIMVTCRIAAKEYTFQRFSDVEVADFNQQQIASFAENWFRHKQIKATNFLIEIKKDHRVYELATIPLLLILLCLEFEGSGSFPANRSELYKEGLDALLQKWDAKRAISRDIVYKDLSVRRKKDMLSQIALKTFEKEEYFFKKEYLEGYIDDYICEHSLNTVNAKPDHKLEPDSEAVLKSIEAQHGLFVERAKEFYSFSHLTFHEYFVAREIHNKRDFEKLIQHIAEPRWKEVFLLVVGMLHQADGFLKSMKEHIDRMLANEENLQKFLEWTNNKTNSLKFSNGHASVRAFYAYVEARARDNNHCQERDSDLNYARNSAQDLAVKLNLPSKLELELEIDRALALDYKIDLNSDPTQILHSELILERILDFDLDELNYPTDRTQKNDLAYNRILEVDENLNKAIEHSGDFGNLELQKSLLLIKSKLPNSMYVLIAWWKNSRITWRAEFLKVCMEHRNIGHDWQFTGKQAELLKQYYAANLLLIECMNHSYDCSKQVREEIEATMLLPRRK